MKKRTVLFLLLLLVLAAPSFASVISHGDTVANPLSDFWDGCKWIGGQVFNVEKSVLGWFGISVHN
jgi:hypothetical protein